MADPKGKNLGVYWGADMAYLVDSTQGIARRTISLPVNRETMARAQDNPLSPEGTKMIAAIQDIIRKHKITRTTVNLSLPSRDIIFRSFIVPWMQSKEIKSVVEFEATKYIPFTLKELAYSYHAMNITVDGNRRLRIIFIAIKKEALKRHTKLLEESALKIRQIEPSPISMIRALIKKQLINDKEIVAVIEKMERSGKIVIIQESTPLFVREFQLAISSNPNLDKTVDTGELLRLTNEVRISLDYFNRQEKNIRVARIIYISGEKSIQEFAKLLEEDLELPTEPASPAAIFDNAEIEDTNYINAFGASLQGEVDMPINIDLSKDAPQTIRIASQTFKKSLNIKEIFPTAVVCSLLMIASVSVSKLMVIKHKAKQAALEEQLGDTKSVSIEKLQFSQDQINKRINAYKQIRLKSNSKFLLETLPQLLPPGAWIQTLSFNSVERPPDPNFPDRPGEITNNLELMVYAYAPTKLDQFQMINNFLQILKDNKELKTYFKDIKLENVRSDQIADFAVTTFLIRCQ
jgi:Tfp pilus assembly PilM family ATPase/Tfp pilus assembly protein PilN